MNRTMKRKEVMRYLTNVSQLAYVRHYRVDDGPGMYMRALEVNNGSGLVFCVLPDRGMDISHASYKGVNLSFLTANANISPAFYEPNGIGWLRTFNGGLLTTCGLTHFGPPSDAGDHGLHGRYSTLPAKILNDESGWKGDEYFIEICGTVEEARLFGDKLRLKRRISCKYAEPLIHVEDTVENFGSEKSPFMILYHVNLGYPLLNENAKIHMNPIESVPRDKDAKSGFDKKLLFHPPTKGFREQVFFHRLKTDKTSWSEVELENGDLSLSLAIRYDSRTLPYLTQWKMAGISDYVLGLEPCNSPCMNRTDLIKKNLIQYLNPGQSKTMRLQIKINEI